MFTFVNQRSNVATEIVLKEPRPYTKLYPFRSGIKRERFEAKSERPIMVDRLFKRFYYENAR
jgi:hypothetical protein